MHNGHLVVCRANDAKDACAQVQDYVQAFGDENNWFKICGAVSEEGEVYIHDKDGRYPPDNKSDTFDKINVLVQEAINSPPHEDDVLVILKKHLDQRRATSVKMISDLAEGKEAEEKMLTGMDWWMVKKYATHMESAVGCHQFDIRTGSFLEGVYTEFGVTPMSGSDDGEHQYVVFVDMHS